MTVVLGNWVFKTRQLESGCYIGDAKHPKHGVVPPQTGRSVEEVLGKLLIRARTMATIVIEGP